MTPAPSSAVLDPGPVPGGSAAVIGGGWVLMVDAAIELAVHIVQKAAQLVASTDTLVITSPQRASVKETEKTR